MKKFLFRDSPVRRNGRKAIIWYAFGECFISLFSRHFHLSNPLLFICPQIFHIIYRMPQVMETTTSFSVLSFATEMINAECLHATNSFVIRNVLLFSYSMQCTTCERTLQYGWCVYFMCSQKKFHFRSRWERDTICCDCDTINVLPYLILCP